MTKDQLIAKVHKESTCMMEFLANIHDKLGNGFAAYLYVMKKITAQISDRLRKDLEKRAYITVSRKLFSIYRFKIANVTKSQLAPSATTVQEEEQHSDQSCEQKPEAKQTTKFSSSIHYYKRDLSPIREHFPVCSIKTPYRQNFSNYDANMMSKDFKSSLLKSMGSGVKCIQSADQDRRLSTYYNQQEVCT